MAVHTRASGDRVIAMVKAHCIFQTGLNMKVPGIRESTMEKEFT